MKTKNIRSFVINSFAVATALVVPHKPELHRPSLEALEKTLPQRLCHEERGKQRLRWSSSKYLQHGEFAGKRRKSRSDAEEHLCGKERV
jgi:hypothetical protein